MIHNKTLKDMALDKLLSDIEEVCNYYIDNDYIFDINNPKQQCFLATAHILNAQNGYPDCSEKEIKEILSLTTDPKVIKICNQMIKENIMAYGHNEFIKLAENKLYLNVDRVTKNKLKIQIKAYINIAKEKLVEITFPNTETFKEYYSDFNAFMNGVLYDLN